MGHRCDDCYFCNRGETCRYCDAECLIRGGEAIVVECDSAVVFAGKPADLRAFALRILAQLSDASTEETTWIQPVIDGFCDTCGSLR